MRISQITGYSYPKSGLRTQSVSNKQKQPQFKGYNSAFGEAATTTLKNQITVKKVYSKLINALVSEGGTTLHPNCNRIGFRPDKVFSEDMIKAIKYSVGEAKLYYGDPLIINSSGNAALIVGENDGLCFRCFDEGRQALFNFSVNSEREIQVDYDDNYSSKTDIFWPMEMKHFGHVKAHREVSGSGLGQVSTTNYYKEDGSEDSVKNFFNYFGI